ncbi:hypothetical protein QE439_000360 [Pedobacter agri]|nr:hypothetical protein [Pedobacter agri]
MKIAKLKTGDRLVALLYPILLPFQHLPHFIVWPTPYQHLSVYRFMIFKKVEKFNLIRLQFVNKQLVTC